MKFANLRRDLSQRLAQATALAHRVAPLLRSQTSPTWPIRGTLLNSQQLEQRARTIAAEHTAASPGGTSRPLLAELSHSQRLLLKAYQTLAADTQNDHPVTPAATWLVDNYHTVVDQIREIRQDLPGGYYEQLPKLTVGPHAQRPRVYMLALELIEHTDGRIELEQLTRFVLAYEDITALTIGEIWAIPIMLRVGLIDNLSRLARATLDARNQRDDGERWAQRILAQPLGESFADNRVLRELLHRHQEPRLPFVVQLLRRLYEHDSEQDTAGLTSWLVDKLALPYSHVDEIIQAEYRRQSSNQVSVANTITSMRQLDAIDWPAWFDQVSRVEQVLRLDPAGAYRDSTYATRDRYRHEIERLARRSGLTEDEIAHRIVAHAAQAAREQRSLYEQHIGYYLIDDGCADFERSIGYRSPAPETAQRLILKYPEASYLGALAGGTAALIALGMREFSRAPKRSTDTSASQSPLVALGVMALLALPASALAKELLDRAITQVLEPRVLPRLDLRNGLPEALRTIVVVPTLLLTAESIRGQIESLEVLYLANEDSNIHFALLSDFADAPEPSMPEDAPLLELACERVRALNERYGADRFLLLHRRRVWNPQQSCWMGWERKRGKLEEFNQLLVGAEETTYEVFEGDRSFLTQVRYVITLDADTQLPRDAARAMIGTLAHPLNQAVIDPYQRRVVKGYGILQPRVGIDVPSAVRTRFARIFSGNIGVDPYTTAVSDVYMDLFGAGVFAGKGIYDPEVVRTVLAGRFPENTLLSHDLIEGTYARAALLSDVELLDSYPTTYAAYAARQHRWIRGDWQIVRWIGTHVPQASGGLAPNVLPLIERFKIFDNLRRSLVPPAAIALLGAGWLGLPGRARVWTGLAIGHLMPPLVFAVTDLLLQAFSRQGIARVVRSANSQLRWPALRLAINLALLPDQASLSIDAITRTLWRLLVARRNLLEWETAAQAQSRLVGLGRELQRSIAPLSAAAATFSALLAERGRARWAVILPVGAVWAAVPSIVRWLGQLYLSRPEAEIDEQDARFLRRIARMTWAYFEEFVRAEDHYLAPDNFQETPRPVIARRTSPTNIGLQLLADLAALDFGYLGIADLTERTGRVLDTLERMDHYYGHLLNWYDTETLHPLPPLYISMVDSGNLAGHLLTLRQGLLELEHRPLAGPWIIDGLRDTLGLIEAEVASGTSTHPDVAALRELLDTPPTALKDYQQLLLQIALQTQRLSSTVLSGSFWGQALQRQVASYERDLDLVTYEPEDGAAPPTLRMLIDCPAPREQGHQADLAQDTDGCAAGKLLSSIQQLATRCGDRVEAMDFRFLYDDQRHLFVIGYNISAGRADASHYDLLASEARLGSFLAIGRGEVPQEHWFYLGRKLTSTVSIPTPFAWSGTMFEYFMPLLVMRTYPETLLDSTYHGVIQRQIAYARERGVPWGVSESAYNVRDLAMNYQYRAFGVPGLALQSGTESDLVVAPYASVLALPVAPDAVIANLNELVETGMLGKYGLYESIDYTRSRLPPGKTSAVISSFMVHHQAMSLLALDNALNNNEMQRRFHADPIVQATELLLQEKIPADAPLPMPQASAAPAAERVVSAPAIRHFTTPHTAVPHTYALSNGAYTTIVTNTGGSVSRMAWLNRPGAPIAVTRSRQDSTHDLMGAWIYLRDTRSGAAWSPTYAPLRIEGQHYAAIYSVDKVEYRQQFAGIDTQLELTVSPEDNAEIRRLTIINRTSEPREIEVTTYAEIVIGSEGGDAAHPAFSNLFVETEFVADHQALLASRRPRSPSDERVWAFHVIGVRGRTIGTLQYETSRVQFLGRGGTPTRPQSLDRALSNSVGAVLDPVLSLRQRLRLVPGASVQFISTIGVALSREEALSLADKYCDAHGSARIFEMSWTRAQIELSHLGITADAAQRFQRLASLALYPDPLRRGTSDTIKQITKGQPGLWAYGVSGDFPIILARIDANADPTLVNELLLAHAFWRMKGLMIDLVLFVEQAGGYRQERYDQIMSLARASQASRWINARGGVYVLREDLVPVEDQHLLEVAARAVLSSRRGDLARHLRRNAPDTARAPISLPQPPPGQELPAIELAARSQYGGFTPSGHEYVIDLKAGEATPAPWSNVVASPGFGFMVTERGGGYTWAENSRENRLTPWSNDPVCDPVGEALYLRDRASGQIWSPLPQPVGAGHFRVRHGMGYTTFEHDRHGIASTVTLTIAPGDSVKLFRLELRNTDAEERQLSVACYVEWVLGVLREQSGLHVVTELDQSQPILYAYSTYNHDFPGRVAFLASSKPASATGDRMEFIGRNSDLSSPIGLVLRHDEERLSGRVGAGMDPCGALLSHIAIPAGETAEIVFVLGQAASHDDARELAERYRDQTAALVAQEQTVAQWRSILDTLQVETPDPSINLLTNNWLLYQTLVCRVWGRSAFYQSGGAYGFRDQLQDVMALADSAPSIAREHILRAASRQFVEGDVQHWWHPPVGRGIRTAFSDDYLWLVFVVCHYVSVTGDRAVLSETVPFLRGRPLKEGEDEYYDLPEITDEQATIYEHCIRALEYSLDRIGAHGLPLMGSGDWNDGMNMVGHGGKGESVWVGWFLIANLLRFAELATDHGDHAYADHCRAEAEGLRTAIEGVAWDGEWYLRAFYDDGTPLGSSRNTECQIDSLSQSWAVISGAGDKQRALEGMEAVDAYLVDREAQLIRLFTPAFDKTDHNPGYIKGYVPGVRENGGQYTHGALWAVWAFAQLGDSARVGELLRMMSPVEHAAPDAARYAVEPYVVVADIYTAQQSLGRGGWTWYTGSAGWLYRLIVEMVLGIRRNGDRLLIAPCLPPEWPGYTAHYHFHTGRYRITVERAAGEGSTHTVSLTVDGEAIEGNAILLADDGQEHEVKVVVQ